MYLLESCSSIAALQPGKSGSFSLDEKFGITGVGHIASLRMCRGARDINVDESQVRVLQVRLEVGSYRSPSRPVRVDECEDDSLAHIRHWVVDR